MRGTRQQRKKKKRKPSKKAVQARARDDTGGCLPPPHPCRPDDARPYLKADGRRPRAPGATKHKSALTHSWPLPTGPPPPALATSSPVHRRRQNLRHRRHRRRQCRHRRQPATTHQTGVTRHRPLPPAPRQPHMRNLPAIPTGASHQPPPPAPAPAGKALLLVLLVRVVRVVHARVRGRRAGRRSLVRVVTHVRLLQGHLGSHKRVERGGLNANAHRVNDLGKRRPGRTVPGRLGPVQLLTEAHGDGTGGGAGKRGRGATGGEEGDGWRGGRHRWGVGGGREDDERQRVQRASTQA